ncbi:MAG: nitrile hydratase subunit alpha [Bacteroidota bacterium]
MSITKSEQHDGALSKYAQVQARFWSDQNFRNQMIENPKGALESYEVGTKSGQALNVVVNDSKTVHLIIPQRPADLTARDAEVLAAGGTFGTGGSIGTAGTACGCAGTFGTVFTFGCADL